MLEISRIIKNPRDFFTKIQAISSIVFVIIHFIIIAFNVWDPPETSLARAILFFGVPLILLSLYLTAIKKVFSLIVTVDAPEKSEYDP